MKIAALRQSARFQTAGGFGQLWSPCSLLKLLRVLVISNFLLEFLDADSNQSGSGRITTLALPSGFVSDHRQNSGSQHLVPENH